MLDHAVTVRDVLIAGGILLIVIAVVVIGLKVLIAMQTDE